MTNTIRRKLARNEGSQAFHGYRTWPLLHVRSLTKGVAGAFPPLSGNPAVMANDATEQIRAVLYGLQGKTIQGTEYVTVMPPWGEQLSDEEVAAVINHERTSWGNDAPPVTAEDVKKVRSIGN